MVEPYTVYLLVGIGCSLLGAIIGVFTWRVADKKGISQDAAWRATVDTMLRNVDQNTQRILDNIEKSEGRINVLESDVSRLKGDVKTLFAYFNKRRD